MVVGSCGEARNGASIAGFSVLGSQAPLMAFSSQDCQSLVGTAGFLISENQGPGFFIFSVIHGRPEVAYKTHRDLVWTLLCVRGLLGHVLHTLWALPCAWHMIKACKYVVFA